jgi:predicted AAA+ superfamily ATPase
MPAIEDSLIPRHATRQVATALADTPVVMVNGPRQCGKTTLVRGFALDGRRYISLDDETALTAARDDPAGFLRPLDRATLDEVQRAPELLRAIKLSVDQDRRPGRFLLTGSADLLSLPTVSDSLAGRMEVVTLLPLSQAELHRTASRFIDQAFSGKAPEAPAAATDGRLVQRILRGGYPEMLRRADPARRRNWARDYIAAIVQRDVRDISSIERLDVLPRLLRILAQHSGQLTNFTQLGGQIGLDEKTARKYLGVVEQLFLVRRLEPWHSIRLSRLVKTPKLHFLDSGLLAALLGVTPERVAGDRTVLGVLLETFVFTEVLKLATVSERQIALYHYRDKDKNEVDIVIEDEAGGVVGLEIKASATVRPADFAGLRKLAAAAGRNFRSGVVLHDGDAVIGFGEHLFAAPLSCLWRSEPRGT